MAPNSDWFVVVFYAILRLGGIVVPINPASAPPEVQYLLEDSGASLFVFDPAFESLVTTISRQPNFAKIEFAALGANPSYPDLQALLAEISDSAPFAATVRETDDALILYTSGTTGRPKGALFDHHRSIWVAVTTHLAFGMRSGDRILHVAPLYHAAELCAFLIPGVMAGSTHVILDRFEPSQVLDILESERITTFFGVPTMYQFLLRSPDLGNRDLSAWRIGLFGAAPMPPVVVEQMIVALPGVQLMQLCGQTEAGPGGIYCTFDQVKQRPDACGRQPLPFTEVRIVDEAGCDIEPGQVGEMILRGETVMKGYWNKPDATAETIRDGWLHTGDLARLDADGYITLVDRLKDLIITGGRNVYSVEVENALNEHPDVVDCAVVGRRHSEYGESIVAVVTSRDGVALTLEEVRAFCATRISAYKVPHELVLATIPRNNSGKALKKQLRETVGIEQSG